MQAALNNKLDASAPYAMSVNGFTGNVVLSKTHLNLGNVDNTSDLDKPISTATQSALNTKVNTSTYSTAISSINSSLELKVDSSAVGSPSGVASLNSSGKIPIEQIPSLSGGVVTSTESANTLSTPRTFSITGDVAATGVSFNGGANVVLNATLPLSGVTASTYGNGTTVPTLTINSKGLITNASSASIPIASNTVQGLVMLENSPQSDDATKAATASALKSVYELANEVSINGIRENRRGAANGVASLDANGKIPSSQMPTTGTIIASQLANTRTLSTTGDAVLSFSFNGSANVTSTATLSTVNSNPGVYGGAKVVPTITVDGKGRITNVTSTNISISYSELTNKPTTVAGYGITNAYIKTEVDNAIASAMDAIMPPGSIIYSASHTVPSNQFLAMKGQAVSRTTYARLFAVIGTTFGAGDGVTTFNVPNASGRFFRVWDDGAGVDPGRGFGTTQEDAFKSHNHTIMIGGDENRVVYVDNGKAVANAFRDLPQAFNGTAQIQPSGSSETRPKNIALQAYIRI